MCIPEQIKTIEIVEDKSNEYSVANIVDIRSISRIHKNN